MAISRPVAPAPRQHRAEGQLPAGHAVRRAGVVAPVGRRSITAVIAQFTRDSEVRGIAFHDLIVARHRVVLRGGTVLIMDPRLGNLPGGDVLIEDGVIAAVAPNLFVDEAETVDVTGHIVAPGMIDTHRHTWQTQLRALYAGWTLVDYLLGIRIGVSPAYLADDVQLGNHLGDLDALNSGVTTILDFSHCNNTRGHADATITGLPAAGIRAVLGYGFFESNPLQPPHFTDHAARLADFRRVADAHFPSRDALREWVRVLSPDWRDRLRTGSASPSCRRSGGVRHARTGTDWQGVRRPSLARPR
ncbi:hypothetical protein ACFZCL_41745 [Streptomyces sp. NPDC008159]|uniref:hypothetical protein n=1 Tax=Streptomyces sp. NPDC008159 TaxID=3364817 RepID=UPI0036E06E51